MPSSRIDFRNYIVEQTGVQNMYFQPPESMKLNYPAIIYSIDQLDNKYANNKNYLQFTSYQMILVDKDPDSELFKILSRLPMCRFVRAYASDNLNHFVFTIYH